MLWTLSAGMQMFPSSCSVCLMLFFLSLHFQTKSKIIKTNLKAINVNKFDLEFEVSSLYVLLLCMLLFEFLHSSQKHGKWQDVWFFSSVEVHITSLSSTSCFIFPQMLKARVAQHLLKSLCTLKIPCPSCSWIGKVLTAISMETRG